MVVLAFAVVLVVVVLVVAVVMGMQQRAVRAGQGQKATKNH